MFRYNRYIARLLVQSTLLTTISLTSIVWLTQVLRLMDYIVNQGIGLGLFFTLTVLMLPSLLMMILPVALFAAVLFVYNKLRQDSELVVMEASGLSHWRLARPALAVACGVMLIGYVISLWLLPVSYAKFRDMQAFLRNNYVSVLLQEGVFNTPVEGLTVFIREREDEGKLKGILVHDTRDKLRAVTMMAEEGKLMPGSNGQRFLLTHGNRQEMREGRLSFLNFDSYVLDMSLYNKAMEEHEAEPREMFIGELIGNRGATSEQTAKLRAELHHRLIWPSYALTMTLVGLAVLFSGEFNRRGSNRRLVVAAALAVLFAFGAVGLRNVMAQHPAFVFLGYALLIMPALISAWALSGMKRASTLRETA